MNKINPFDWIVSKLSILFPDSLIFRKLLALHIFYFIFVLFQKSLNSLSVPVKSIVEAFRDVQLFHLGVVFFRVLEQVQVIVYFLSTFVNLNDFFSKKSKFVD